MEARVDLARKFLVQNQESFKLVEMRQKEYVIFRLVVVYINDYQGNRSPRLCVKGSELHKKLYDESLKSFEGVLQLAKEHGPKIITSPPK